MTEIHLITYTYTVILEVSKQHQHQHQHQGCQVVTPNTYESGGSTALLAKLIIANTFFNVFSFQDKRVRLEK